MSDATIFVIRSDENEKYDRALHAEYLSRLKANNKNILLAREVVKPDRIHIEIVEASNKAEQAEHEANGFAKT